ncbi:TlpA family protein disulfide reductase [Capnocytophaga cynodegmi]|uniref:Putative Thiol:disulfide interchange protein DsbE n=1 Tax=Capnocytophaga cynodegmi TaxID=28189 RepID=A0A0B7HNZ6_9FLAO|nr:TlpA disulfide reductase family protein [Capnocytophaga cynodegmi]CEN35383.1 putative Thiol:disulfide interchange protein DsbE [Capnocytophaga cynodegmi]CEN40359.1 putative Thiol:disulfide interchange protein DsbE [Capnocytophaga cynodegmi]
MKLLSSIFIILFAFNIANTQAQNKTVDVPPFGFANTKTLEIRKVSLSEKETLLEVDAFFTPGYWIRIASDTYLKAGDKKYKIRKGEGIVLDSLFWMPKSGEASFKLVFEPLPLKTEKFDFIEGDCKDCFKIYDIDLSKKQSHKINIPKEFQQKHQVTKNFSVKWQKGKGLISGKIIGYKPDLGDVVFIYPNPITGNRDKNLVTISEDGTFKINTTIYSPTSLILRSDSFNIPLVVAPDKELKVLINLPEIQRKQSRLQKNIVSKVEEIYFSGFMADINNEVYKFSHKSSYDEKKIDSVANFGVETLEKYLINEYKKAILKNNSLKINALSKKILNLQPIHHLVYDINMSYDYVIKAYVKKHNISFEEAVKQISIKPRKDEFYNIYKEIPYNDYDILLSPVVSNLIHNLSLFRKVSGDIYTFIDFVLKHPKTTEDDKIILKEFVESKQNVEEFKKAKELQQVFLKNKDLLEEYNKKNQGTTALAEIWGTDKTLLLDLIKARNIANQFSDYKPLTEENKEEIKSFPIEIQQILIDGNDELLAQIEENKKKTGFTVLNVPQTSDEQLLVEMLKPFKGKVILIDMWATWCRPCLAANKQMEPLKAEFADKDVIFLYLAGENSPEQTWKNMISDIKGQHYRINKNQWEYLGKTLNIKSLPSYVIFDKEGNHFFQSVGFPNLNTIKNELLKALEK